MDDKETKQGGATDAAHQDAGDGSATGSVPAGSTVKELLERAENGPAEDGGTG